MQVPPVFIGGLRRDTTTEELLTELMSNYGTIKGLRFLGTYAFVYYETEEQAKRAVEETDGMYWNGSRVGSRLQVDRPKREAEACVFVGGLHTNATEGFVRQYFEPYGEILRVIIKDRGFGFIHFAKAADAEAAVSALHGIAVEGRGSLTVRIQTEENRQKTTKVRDVVDGVMKRKTNFEAPQAGLEVYIGGFGTQAGDDQIELAIKQLCHQYGEVESITTHVSSGIVRFKSYESTKKFSEDFKYGAKWGDKDLQVKIQEVANASTVNGAPVRNNPVLQVPKGEQTPYVSITGFPPEFTASDINDVVSVLFINRPEPNSFVSAQDGIAVIKCESEADKASLLSWGSKGIPWGENVLTISDYHEKHNFDHSACLSITRIASTVNRRELTILFGLYGEILNVSKITKGTANILYKDRKSVDAAMNAVAGHVLDGIPIELARGFKADMTKGMPKGTPPSIIGEQFAPYDTKRTRRYAAQLQVERERAIAAEKKAEKLKRKQERQARQESTTVSV